MINVEYSPRKEEIVESTLDFLLQRPVMRAIFYMMKISCLILCIGFAFKIYSHAARPEDFTAVFFAVIWLFFYKKINRWVINRTIKNRNLQNISQKFNIDRKRIFYTDANSTTVNLEWRKVKYLLKKSEGYILPLTGISNTGKYLWLPDRGFESEEKQNEFTDLLKTLKINVKKIK